MAVPYRMPLSDEIFQNGLVASIHTLFSVGNLPFKIYHWERRNDFARSEVSEATYVF